MGQLEPNAAISYNYAFIFDELQLFFVVLTHCNEIRASTVMLNVRTNMSVSTGLTRQLTHTERRALMRT